MYILGINPGHNGTAALLKDGKIVACVSEERFSRLKNHVGFPHKAIKYCLEYGKIKSKQLDYVILSTTTDDLTKPGRVYDIFKVLYATKSFQKRIFGYLAYNYPDFMNPIINFKHEAYNKIKNRNTAEYNSKEIARIFGIEKERVLCIDHHLSHALSCCFNLPRNNKTLIFTLDGEGDFLCASVNVYDGKEIKRIAKTDKSASLGYLYAIATLFLGMKPNEHEFKVMGLAPYAKKDKVDKLYDSFKEILWVDGLEFKSKFRMQYADSFFQDKIRYERFDTIAGAVQKLTENLICKWVLNAIDRTGIKNLAVSGGVMMNVKACQKISELPEVDNIFVMPSAGDESTAIGACFYGYKLFCEKNEDAFKPVPLQDLYLGPEYEEAYVEKMIKEKELDKKHKIKKFNDVNKEIAKLLAKGEIVARCTGRGEFGARALGNRSILANPKHPDTIRILNETIKDRDFWMPFTPSVLDIYEKKYFVNKKKIFAPYMTLTFESTKEAREKMLAAMHPYDFTVRPQIVTKDYNSEYYELIKEFAKLTGTGAVLNTSFNLHGEPNVLTPEDALHTVENSALKYLAIGDYMFEKKI